MADRWPSPALPGPLDLLALIGHTGSIGHSGPDLARPQSQTAHLRVEPDQSQKALGFWGLPVVSCYDESVGALLPRAKLQVVQLTQDPF